MDGPDTFVAGSRSCLVKAERELLKMIIQPNPFYYGGAIKETRYFVNRKPEVMEIYEAIVASASVSVVGERRVGKSSLLINYWVKR
jgi:hypothetical protein